MIINVKTQLGSYDINLGRGIINSLKDYCDNSVKALIVTDSGVPEMYSEIVAEQFPNSIVKVIPQGEQSKNFDTFKDILATLCENEFSRKDCVIAVGGGVVGDLSGFCASAYMRGIDFYNIPTTLLSQVDSSIGGKTAIDFGGYKNIVGAFYQPKAVFIDPNVLETLSPRQFSNGLAESIKMAATSDKALFEMLEKGTAYKEIDTVIERSLMIKKAVVEEDEKEQGLRKVLNFGHTAAHAIETATGLGDYLHGECVAIGMMAFSSAEAGARIKTVLEKYNLPTGIAVSGESVFEALRHDKKTKSNGVDVVWVEKIGSFDFRFIEFSELDELIKEAYIQ